MSGGGVNFQTPTALYSSIAGQPGYGTLYPAAGLGWPGTTNTGPGSVFYNALTGINNLGSYGSNYTGALDSAARTGASMLPYASQALQQGFDPQGALYNKLFQQQQDQSNATNAMSGVATTPYGAALTQQGNQNFDLAWQQQQLANQAQGASTASNLLGSAISGINAPMNANQQQIQDYLNYIAANVGEGSAIAGATNSATNAGANSTNSLAAAEQANNSGKSGIGSAFSGIGQLFGKTGTGASILAAI